MSRDFHNTNFYGLDWFMLMSPEAPSNRSRDDRPANDDNRTLRGVAALRGWVK